MAVPPVTTANEGGKTMIEVLTIAAGAVALICAATYAGLVEVPQWRSRRAVEALRRAWMGMPVHLSAHDAVTGKNLSIPMFVDERSLGTLTRLVRERRLTVTAVEGFDRADPRHVQSLRGTLDVIDLEIAERGASRADAIKRSGPGVDDLMRLAEHARLHHLARMHDLLDPLTTAGDAGRTLAMPTFDAEALEAYEAERAARLGQVPTANPHPA